MGDFTEQVRTDASAKNKVRNKIMFAGKPAKKSGEDTKKSEARKNALARRLKARKGNGRD